MNRLSLISRNFFNKINFIKNISFDSTKPPSQLLGRWARDYNHIDKKVDYANEDHCGLCDTYRLKKIEELKIEELKK